MALPGDLSCTVYTCVPCNSKLIKWTKKEVKDYFTFLREHSNLSVEDPRTLSFIFIVFSSCLSPACWIKNVKEWKCKIDVKNTVFWKISTVQDCIWGSHASFVYKLDHHYDPPSFTVSDLWKYLSTFVMSDIICFLCLEEFSDFLIFFPLTTWGSQLFSKANLLVCSLFPWGKVVPY